MCAETLRQENYGGRIIMVSRDDLLPYDKTRLSKVRRDLWKLVLELFLQEKDVKVAVNIC